MVIFAEYSILIAIAAAAVLLARATYGIWQIASDFDAGREVN